jgi:hypothetical protein
VKSLSFIISIINRVFNKFPIEGSERLTYTITYTMRQVFSVNLLFLSNFVVQDAKTNQQVWEYLPAIDHEPASNRFSNSIKSIYINTSKIRKIS